MILFRFLPIVLLLSLVFVGIYKHIARINKHTDENDFVMYPSRSLLWIAAICITFFSSTIVVMLVFPNDTVSWWGFLIAILLMALGLFLYWCCIIWEVRVSGNEIWYTNILGTTRIFTFDDISIAKTKITEAYIQVTIYSEKKNLLSVGDVHFNFQMFMTRLVDKGIKLE